MSVGPFREIVMAHKLKTCKIEICGRAFALRQSIRVSASGSQPLYRKDTETLYHAFMYQLVSLLSGIYPVLAMHSLLATIICCGIFIGIN